MIGNTKKGINSLIINNGSNNSAFGFNSLMNNETGHQNTGIGSESLSFNDGSINNTAVGYRSLAYSSGKYNTALGALSGLSLVTGEKNVVIGKHADVSGENAKNQIVIGAGAVGYRNNTVVLGNNKIEKILAGKNNQVDLGSRKVQFKDIHIDGEIYKDGNLKEPIISNKIPTYINQFGSAGQVKYDKNYIYIGVGDKKWHRSYNYEFQFFSYELLPRLYGSDHLANINGVRINNNGRIIYGEIVANKRNGQVFVKDYNHNTKKWEQVGSTIYPQPSSKSKLITDPDRSADVYQGDGTAFPGNDVNSMALSSNGLVVYVREFPNEALNFISRYEFNTSTNNWDRVAELYLGDFGETSDNFLNLQFDINDDGSKIILGCKTLNMTVPDADNPVYKMKVTVDSDTNNRTTTGGAFVFEYDSDNKNFKKLGEKIVLFSDCNTGGLVKINKDGTIIQVSHRKMDNDDTTYENTTSTQDIRNQHLLKQGAIQSFEWRLYTQEDKDNDTYIHTSNFLSADKTMVSKKVIITANHNTAPVVGKYYWTQLGFPIFPAFEGSKFSLFESDSLIDYFNISNDGKTIVQHGNVGGDNGELANNGGRTLRYPRIRVFKYRTFTESDVDKYEYKRNYINLVHPDYNDMDNYKESQTFKNGEDTLNSDFNVIEYNRTIHQPKPLIFVGNHYYGDHFTVTNDNVPIVGEKYWTQVGLDIRPSYDSFKEDWGFGYPTYDGSKIIVEDNDFKSDHDKRGKVWIYEVDKSNKSAYNKGWKISEFYEGKFYENVRGAQSISNNDEYLAGSSGAGVPNTDAEFFAPGIISVWKKIKK